MFILNPFYFIFFPAAGEEANMDLPDNNDLLASVESTSELPTASATSPDVGKRSFQFNSSENQPDSTPKHF